MKLTPTNLRSLTDPFLDLLADLVSQPNPKDAPDFVTNVTKESQRRAKNKTRQGADTPNREVMPTA